MMQVLEQMVGAIPDAGRTPLSLLAFLALAITVLALGLRTRRLSALSRNLRDLPEADRRKVLETEMNQPLPTGMDAEQWLRHQRQRYVLIGFLSVLAFAVVLTVIVHDPVPPPGAASSTAATTPPPPPPASATSSSEIAARQAMTNFYNRTDDSKSFDMWLEAHRAQYGSLSGFRQAADRIRKQLIEIPVQRKKLSVDATSTQALALFDAETDSGMFWRERLELLNVDGVWKISSLLITPSAWSNINLPYTPATLTAFVESTEGQPEAVGAIPLPGWNVRTLTAPVAGDQDKKQCDVQVVSDGKHALMRGVYGACDLSEGTNLLVLGVATKRGGDFSLSMVRFYLM